MDRTILFPTSIYYDIHDGRLITWLCGIDDDGNSRKIPLFGTKPAFWVDEKPHEHEHMTGYVMDDGVDFWGKPLHRIEVEYPFQVPEVRRSYVNTYEADMYYDRRVRFDYGIQNCISIPKGKKGLQPEDIEPVDPEFDLEPRIWTLDIETHYEGGRTNADYPTDEVLSVAIHDSKANKYIVILNGELSDEDRDAFLKRCQDRKEDLTEDYQDEAWDVRISTVASESMLFMELTRIMNYLQPQIIRGWNFCRTSRFSGGFDWPYLTNRARNMGFAFPNKKRFQVWDCMEAYVRMHARSSGLPKDGKGLDAVSFNEGIGRKVQHSGILDMYKNDRAKFLFYNVMDVFLTKTIDEKAFNGITRFYLEIARQAGCSLQDTTSDMRVVDHFTSHWIAKNRPEIKQPSSANTRDRDVVGGIVFQPRKGVHGPTAQLDLAQAYTGVIRALNMSPETKVRGEPDPTRTYATAPSGRMYYTDIRGIFPSILDGLAAKMDALKAAGRHDERAVQKSINHGFYGNMKNMYYRNRDVDIAEDILQTVHMQVRHNAKITVDEGFEIIYGDTDSLFPHRPGTAEELESAARSLADKINGTYDEMAKQLGIDEHNFRIDFEDVYVAQLFAQKSSGKGDAKKRYAALKPNGKMVVKGFDFRRSDRAPFARKIQHDTLRLILETRDPLAVRRHIMEVQQGLRDGSFPITDLAIPKGLGNDPKAYLDRDGAPIKGCPQHFKAAIWSNANLDTDFQIGDKVFLYHGYINGKPKTKVFALPWGVSPPAEARIDTDEHIRLTFQSPLTPILDALDISWYDAISGTVGTKLETFL